MDSGWYVLTVGALTYASMMAFRLRQAGPAHLPVVRWLFNVMEAISMAWLVLAALGFFLVPWYVPILAILGGAFAVRLTPHRIVFTQGPFLVTLGTLAGVALFFSTWSWAWRTPGF